MDPFFMAPVCCNDGTVTGALVQVGLVQKAIDCCAQLNNWALGVKIAQEHGIQIENLLNSRMSELRKHGRCVDEVNLYKSAAQHHLSASSLAELAKEAIVRTP